MEGELAVLGMNLWIWMNLVIEAAALLPAAGAACLGFVVTFGGLLGA